VQQYEGPLLGKGKHRLTEKLVVVCKRTYGPINKSRLQKAKPIQALPIFPADMVQVTFAKPVWIRIPTLAITTGKNRAATKFSFHQLCFDKEAVTCA
jgi:hypothetical protein